MSNAPVGDARRPIRRALVSVYDKTGLESLVKALAEAGVEIVSTGSTAQRIAACGVAVTGVEDVTGFPECLDGRVKTLHPKVHGGLLADLRLESHAKQLAELGVEPFDLLVSNLYPFTETVASGADHDACVEQIDIGGPAMVRAAAKNYASVAVVTSPEAYAQLIEAVRGGGYTLAQRRALAATAFADIADYDVAVARWLATEQEPEATFAAFDGLSLRRKATLRYGENPHQSAALYTDGAAPAGLAQAEQLHGKEMSYNNYVDTDAAWRSANDFAEPCVAIIKHANPCGLAIGADVAEAHRRANECDPVSAYGGVIACNGEVTLEMARQVAEIFTEVIVAPAFAAEALEVLRTKKNLRVLLAPAWAPAVTELRQISGGILCQTSDRFATGMVPSATASAGDAPSTWRRVAGPEVDEATMADLSFGWRAVRSVKSNAILLAAGGATVGVGMGQVNRVDSARLAVSRAGERASGSVAASDAFFPFADGLNVLIEAGVRAAVEPGGSIRDAEVIAAAEAAGITLFFTGTRHFFH